jgi:hypothetical protein
MRLITIAIALFALTATAEARHHWRYDYSTCRENYDCPGEAQCRDRGDGVMSCMANQPYGAVCQYNNDCGILLDCRDRGDGIHVCM